MACDTTFPERLGMRWSRIIAAMLAICAGSLTVVLAQDVRSWHGALSQDALRFEAYPTGPLESTAPAMLPSGLSADVLGVHRDRAWLDALSEFTLVNHSTTKLTVLDPRAYRLLKSGQAALTKLTRDPNPARASQAYNLLAALEFREALPGTGIVHGLVQNTLSDLEDALRLDPSDEVVSENIELVLRYITVAIPPEQQQSRGLGRHANKYPKGGYAGPPGEGY